MKKAVNKHSDKSKYRSSDRIKGDSLIPSQINNLAMGKCHPAELEPISEINDGFPDMESSDSDSLETTTIQNFTPAHIDAYPEVRGDVLSFPEDLILDIPGSGNMIQQQDSLRNKISEKNFAASRFLSEFT